MLNVYTWNTPYTRQRVALVNPHQGWISQLVSPSEEDEGEATVRVFINDTEVGDHPSGAISFHQPLISPLRVVQHLITPGGTLVAPQEVLMKTNLTQNGGRTYFLLRLLLSPSIPLRLAAFPLRRSLFTLRINLAAALLHFPASARLR